MNTMENSWFEGKKVAAILAVVTFFAGFLFVDRGGISGNTILDGSYSVNIVSLVGLFLVICSVVLVVYLLRKR